MLILRCLLVNVKQNGKTGIVLDWHLHRALYRVDVPDMQRVVVVKAENLEFRINENCFESDGDYEKVK